MAVVAVGQVAEVLTKEGRALLAVVWMDRGNEASAAEYLTAASMNVMVDGFEPLADCVKLW